MSLKNEIHVGDIGTAIILALCDKGVALDISTATTTQIKLQRQGEASTTYTATFVTDGTDGEIQYITSAGNLDGSGEWRAQAYVVMPTGSWHSSKVSFSVHENL